MYEQAEQKHYHDQHARERQFVEGQEVMVRNFRPGPDWIQARISQTRTTDIYGNC